MRVFPYILNNIKIVLLSMLLALFASTVYAQDAQSCGSDPNCIRTESFTNSNINSETTVTSPPPSAISPSINASNSDSCTIGVAGAVQTQILGISAGKTVRDVNCERLKNAKTMYDMGMKVAAVSIMCQDERIFKAMWDAGTPCPFDGLIGQQAKDAWNENPEKIPGFDKEKKKWRKMDEDDKSVLKGSAAVGGLLLLLLL
jgi:hypothetical protein